MPEENSWFQVQLAQEMPLSNIFPMRTTANVQLESVATIGCSKDMLGGEEDLAIKRNED